MKGNCKGCGCEIERSNNRQYCLDCSHEAEKARRRRYEQRVRDKEKAARQCSKIEQAVS